MSSTSQSSEKSEIFTAKADMCQAGAASASIGGAKGGASVSASAASCGSQSESRNQGKSEASTNLEVTIKGGDPKARAALSTSREQSAIKTWIQSERDWNKIVDWKFESIWNIMYRIFPEGSEHYMRATNLEMEYLSLEFQNLADGNTHPICAIYELEPFLKDNVDGYTDRVTNIKSPFHCQFECQIHATCEYWSLDTASFDCMIWAQPSNELSFKQSKGFVAGEETCPPNLQNIPSCAKAGLKIDGSKIGPERMILLTGDAMQCQNRCGNIAACTSWTFFLDPTTSKWSCELFKDVNEYVEAENSFVGARTCLYPMTQDSIKNPIENQIHKMRLDGLEIWDINTASFFNYQLKFMDTVCMDYWKRLDTHGLLTLEKCAAKCYDSEFCLFFAYGKDNHAKQCYNAGMSCKRTQKQKGIGFDIFILMGKQPNDFTLLAKFAKCSLSLMPISANEIKFIETPLACATKCRFQFDSEIFYWDVKKMNLKNQCRCSPDPDFQCSISSHEKCCPYKKCIDAQYEYCEVNQKPTWHVYKILETLNENLNILKCPSINTFVTTTMPPIDQFTPKWVDSCNQFCRKNDKCQFSMYHVKTNQCFLLSGAISSITTKKGWITNTRDCSKTMDGHVSSLYWDDSIYI